MSLVAKALCEMVVIYKPDSWTKLCYQINFSTSGCPLPSRRYLPQAHACSSPSNDEWTEMILVAVLNNKKVFFRLWAIKFSTRLRAQARSSLGVLPSDLSLKATFQISIFPKTLRFQAKVQDQVSGTGEDKAFVRSHLKEGPEINLCQFCDGSNPYLAFLSFILKV